MYYVANKVIQVVDAEIKHLAERSQALNQETRITVYTFNHKVTCAIYDKDVLRLPSISEHYKVNGMTALIDATLKSQDDLAQTAQLYGSHAFLTYVFTDGEENASKNSPAALLRRLQELPDNWTVAVFVPNQAGKFEAKKFGFPADNIAVWDVSERGVYEVGEIIRQTTDTYMQARTTGVHGSRTLFSTSPDALNKQTVKDAKLKQLASGSYKLINVANDAPIREFVQDKGYSYTPGCGYYQLTKTESIQPQKKIAVRNKKTGRIYTGDNARDLLGLPAMEVRVRPDYNPEFDVYVQSTSVNRKLIKGTKLLLLL